MYVHIYLYILLPIMLLIYMFSGLTIQYWITNYYSPFCQELFQPLLTFTYVSYSLYLVETLWPFPWLLCQLLSLFSSCLGRLVSKTLWIYLLTLLRDNFTPHDLILWLLQFSFLSLLQWSWLIGVGLLQTYPAEFTWTQSTSPCQLGSRYTISKQLERNLSCKSRKTHLLPRCFLNIIYNHIAS